VAGLLLGSYVFLFYFKASVSVVRLDIFQSTHCIVLGVPVKFLNKIHVQRNTESVQCLDL